MAIPMEDNFEDILGKALRGTGMADGVLEFLTGVPEAKIAALKEGERDDEALRAVASPLGLDAATLVERAGNAWAPEPVELEGLRQFSSHYGDMLVNSYLVWDPSSKEAALFDTGADSGAALAAVGELGLSLTAQFQQRARQSDVGAVDVTAAVRGKPESPAALVGKTSLCLRWVFRHQHHGHGGLEVR